MNKVALITGSAGGLAVSFAHKLAESGFSLVLNYRNSSERAHELAEKLSNLYKIPVKPMQADMQNQTELELMMEEIERDFQRLDVLVHSAGPYIFARKRLTEYSDAQWREMLDGNLSSAFYLFRKAIPIMRKNGFGRIVTIGFDRVNDAPGWAFRSAYAAAKVGLASLTKTVSIEERDNGITANMICPGDIRGKAKESMIPNGQPGSPLRQVVGGDLAQVIHFLIQETSSFISGNVITVSDGTDVIGKSDLGKESQVNESVLEIGTKVWVHPLAEIGTIVHRQDTLGSRSIYTVEIADTTLHYTIDQLEEGHEYDI